MASRLGHWPVKLQLLGPQATFLKGSDMLLLADCAGVASPNLHERILKGKTVAIACPKLDSNQETYREKLTALIDQAGVRSITVLMMQVPCCSGLLRHAVEAASRAKHSVPIRCVVVGLQGEILREMSVQATPRAQLSLM